MELASRVWPRQVATYLFCSFLGVSLTTFISVIQPYVLTVNLGLEAGRQGQVSGDMVFYGEVVMLLLSAVVGVVSDRYGRRTGTSARVQANSRPAATRC